jgi:hypothetical protein
MSNENHFLALFVGSRTNPRAQAFFALPEAERKAKEKEGIAAWGAWMSKHQAIIVGQGGPVGKTKRVSANGIADISNEVGGFVVVKAASHEEAAKLFLNHPHFTNFPGEAVEVMPVMPIPNAG